MKKKKNFVFYFGVGELVFSLTYYCWKWPEEELAYFHGYEEGFGGRVRIQ